jgi:hypothetical protein
MRRTQLDNLERIRVSSRTPVKQRKKSKKNVAAFKSSKSQSFLVPDTRLKRLIAIKEREEQKHELRREIKRSEGSSCPKATSMLKRPSSSPQRVAPPSSPIPEPLDVLASKGNVLLEPRVTARLVSKFGYLF